MFDALHFILQSTMYEHVGIFSLFFFSARNSKVKMHSTMKMFVQCCSYLCVWTFPAEIMLACADIGIYEEENRKKYQNKTNI